jgi:hypothetical protein
MKHEDKGAGTNPEEEIADEVIDLEAFSKTGKRPPRARAYRFKVNDDVFEWPKPVITGREVLTLAGLTPPENYSLRLKVAGGKPRKIELNDKVDLREPGVEKFRAIRKDQNDGEYQGRRDAPLLDADEGFLKGYGLPFDIVADGSTWVILRDFPLPDGFNEKRVSVAIRLEQGYPFTALDMMYVFPALKRLDGKPIPQTESMQAIEGKQYQRWSRHRTGDNPWVPNKDSLETHVYLIEEWFARETGR